MFEARLVRGGIARTAALFGLFVGLALVLSFGGGMRPGTGPAEAQTAGTPLILVPGVGGSHIMSGTTEKWPRANDLALSTSDDFLMELALRADGTEDPARDYAVGDIVRKAHVSIFPDPDFYYTTVEKLKAAGYREGVDLFVYPYDWRKDVRGNNGRGNQGFLGFVDGVRARTGAAKVDVMAHSMGGMVTLAALENPASVGKIRNVLTVGTPVLGATKSLGMLQYRMPCFVEPMGICITNKETTQKLLTNMTSGYQLLPSRAFDRAVRAPLYIDMDTNGDGVKEGTQTYSKWSSTVRASRNGSMLTAADSYHYASDTLTLADPAVKLTRVVGDAMGTVDRIRQYKDCFLGYFSCDTEYELQNGDGDGTVPLHSADVYNPNTGLDLRGPGRNVYFHGVEHGDLVKNDGVMTYAVSYFGRSATTTAATTFTAQPAFAAEGTEDDEPAGGFDGVELEVVGPATGYVEDAEGRVVGEAKNLPARDGGDGVIPNATYNAIDETKSFFFNESGSYSGRLDVTGEDSAVRVRARLYDAGELSGQAVFFVQAPRGASLLLRFGDRDPAGLSGLKLEVDRDGDGRADERLSPDSVVTGILATDDAVPGASASVERLPNGKAKVSLEGEDRGPGRGGAGVSSLRYVVGEGSGKEKVKTYRGPFVVPAGETVRFLAVDRAGNAGTVREVEAG